MFKGTFQPYCDMLGRTPLKWAGRLDLSYCLFVHAVSHSQPSLAGDVFA